MRIRFEKTITRFPVGVVPVVVFYIGLILYYILLSITTHRLDFCLFHMVTGVNCPMCGLSSAFMSISRGDVLMGILHNPLMVVVTLMFIIYLTLPLAFRRTVKVDLSPEERRLYYLMMLVLFMLNWLVFVL